MSTLQYLDRTLGAWFAWIAAHLATFAIIILVLIVLFWAFGCLKARMNKGP